MPATLRTHLPALIAAGCIGFAFALLWPSHETGWSSDDFVFQAMMDGEFAAPRHPLDLFNFADGTLEDATALRRHGYPWYTPDDFKISMMRPLASALIWFDRIVLGDRVWLHHVHSMLWWLVLVIAAHRLYQGRFAPTIALPALLLFAIDTSHHTPVTWLANRGGLVSVALGLWALLCHLRWREQDRPAHGLLSAVLFSAALLCGEWVFCIFAYVFAYELLQGRGTLLRRGLSLLPAAVPALAFLIIRGSLGYGARGSGVYSDPVGQPEIFFGQLGSRLAVSSADLLLDVPSDWWSAGSPWRDGVLHLGVFSSSQWARLPNWTSWHVALGILAAVIGALGLRAAWRGCEPTGRATLGWLLLGALLSLLPVAGSFPSRRLVLAAMIGVAPALALVLRALVRSLIATAASGRMLSFAGSWCAFLLVLDLHVLATLRVDLRANVVWVRTAEHWVKGAELDPERVGEQAVITVSAVDFVSTIYFPSTWRDAQRPVPRATYTLSIAPYAHLLRRTADNAFELDVLGGSYLSTDMERHFRASTRPLFLGQRIQLDDMTVEVRRMLGALPRTVSFTFREPLESPRYVFLSHQRGGISRVDLPAVGEQVVLPRAVTPDFGAQCRKRYEAPMAPLPRFLTFDPVPSFVQYDPSDHG